MAADDIRLMLGRRPAAKVKSDAAVSRLVLLKLNVFLVTFYVPGWLFLDNLTRNNRSFDVKCPCWN